MLDPNPQDPTVPAGNEIANNISEILAPSFGCQNGKELLNLLKKSGNCNTDAVTFLRITPSFIRSTDNADKVDSYMRDKGMNPTLNNFKSAFNTLKMQGIL